jgi:hypothetical protein
MPTAPVSGDSPAGGAPPQPSKIPAPEVAVHVPKVRLSIARIALDLAPRVNLFPLPCR